ncbi:serine/threonine-protein kinase [Polyangium aurulentum]|uniref:serine/threonine-protein kinase n=1 Tax=Polyangium aurulentum TaxID=2567896 RepID=UPI0010ADFD44|nr:serine/threonine-protein kinase [Polyangium aurulentum]UQA55873.1 serine/threonine protein kinase [Polyangium aurulentum]
MSSGLEDQPPAGRPMRAIERPRVDPRGLLGQVIAGRYRIEDLIGEGGMGAVYRAQHTGMKKRLAVKVLHPEMLGLNEAVERFEREAIAGAHIEHPNVAAASDFGRLDDGSYFLVLELLEGEHLRSIINRGPLPVPRALRIAQQIAHALRAVHKLGIVHRDLKPDNVMLARRERESDVVKILDFGIAKVPVNALAATRPGLVNPLTKTGMAYGTPEYMAPEQALGEEIDGRVDLYALGVMLYEMLSGARPFDAESRVQLLGMVASKPAPRLSERFPLLGVPPRVEAITMRLLEKSKDARFATADEVIAALDEALAALDRAANKPAEVEMQRAAIGEAATIYALNPVPANPTSMPTARPPMMRRGQPLTLLAASGLLLIAGLVITAVSLRNKAALDALEDAAQPTPIVDAGAPDVQATAAADAAPAPPPEPARPNKATPDELEDAQAKGAPALAALAERYGSDPAVLEALVVAYAKEKASYKQAVRTTRKLLEVAPEKATDPDVERAMLMVANGPLDTADGAIELMATNMGSRGPDLLYELVTAPGIGKYPKERAGTLLKDPVVRRLATPALLMANDLRVAAPCSRKDLFDRAKVEGDARTLGLLKPMLVTKGCGMFRRSDCFACLKNRAELRATIDAIEKRLGK